LTGLVGRAAGLASPRRPVLPSPGAPASAGALAGHRRLGWRGGRWAVTVDDGLGQGLGRRPVWGWRSGGSRSSLKL